MIEAVIALVSTLLGAGISTLAQLVSFRREDRREESAHREKQYEALSALYEEALFTLDRNARARGLGTRDEANQTVRLLARFRLTSTDAIREQYLATGDLLDEWTAEYRAGAPKPGPEPGMITINVFDSKHEEKAKALYPGYVAAFEKLQEMMKAHLASFTKAE